MDIVDLHIEPGNPLCLVPDDKSGLRYLGLEDEIYVNVEPGHRVEFYQLEWMLLLQEYHDANP